MLQAMFAGVTGLDAHQTSLDVIGNNIANVNTVGFKSSSANFEDQLSQTIRDPSAPSGNLGGINPSQVGLGVLVGSVDTNNTQGNLQSTGNNTDLAIQGDGYFIVSGGNGLSYTRAGGFNLDSNGELVSSDNGMKLLGFQADATGKIDTTQQVTAKSAITIPVGTLTSLKQTSEATLQGNLDASSALQSTAATVSGPLDLSSTPAALNTTVYDSLGNSHTLQVQFASPIQNPTGTGVPAGATQEWTVTATLDGAAHTANLFAVGGAFIFADPGTGASLGSRLSLQGIGAGGAPNFPLTVDFSGLTDKSAVSAAADGQAQPTPIASTQVGLSGNLNLDNVPPAVTTQVFDSTGRAYSITTTFSSPTFNPTGAGVPAGATASYNVKIQSGATTLYDSSAAGNNESKAYYVPGQGFVLANHTSGASLGSVIQLAGAAPGADNQGQEVATGLPIAVDLSKLTTSDAAGAANGQAGSAPTWHTSVTVYDGQGVGHNVDLNFTRALVGSGAPSGAVGRWEWTASENGAPLGSSTTAGNQALFFGSSGNLLDTSAQTITITPQGGAAPLKVSLNMGALTQVAASANVTVQSQDGFAAGTLQSFTIGSDGLISGAFTNGQSQTLAQIATALFANPSGLESMGQNAYIPSVNSGTPQVGVPTTNGRGSVSSGYLEMSNVDLSSEFTNLIVTQRGYQANTKIITAVDQLLQDVLNIIR